MAFKITFLFPKNYKHGLLGNDFYSETIEFSEDVDIYKRFDITGFIDNTFKRTSIWKKLNHFSFIPYFEWKCVFKDEINIYYVYKASPLIKIIYKNHELNYLHNPYIKDILFDLYLIYGINVKLKNKNIPVISDKYLDGDYVIDLSDIEYQSETKKEYQDVFSL